MSLPEIKKALELHLSQLTPVIQTAYEGVSFTPQSGVPYQRVFLVPRTPENPTMGDGHYKEVGEFQIFLCYPTNKGTGEILSKAESIKLHFKRGTSLFEGDTVVKIIYTPQIAGSSILGDRILVPIIIRYESDVFI